MASHSVRGIEAVVLILMVPEVGPRYRNVVETKVGGEVERANQQGALVMRNYNCIQINQS